MSRIELYYDVSRLLNQRLNKSGISRFVRETFAYMKNHPDVTLRPTVVVPEWFRKSATKKSIEDFETDFDSELSSLPLSSLDRSSESSALYSPYGPLPSTRVTVGIPRVITIHDTLHYDQRRFYWRPDSRYHISRTLDSITSSDWIHAVSGTTRASVMRFLDHDGAKIRAIPLAASEGFNDTPHRSDGVTKSRHGIEDTQYFVIFAQFDPRKNLGLALKAAKEFLKTRDQKWKTVIISSPVNEEKLISAIQSAGLPEERYEIASGLSDRECASLYRGARFVCYLSLGEGFGLPVLEAMSCGCPVICAPVTSIPEVAMDAGIYVDPNSLSSILNAMMRLAESDTLWDSARQRSLEVAALFSWDRTNELLFELIDLASSRRKRRLWGSLGILRESTETKTLRSEALLDDFPSTFDLRFVDLVSNSESEIVAQLADVGINFSLSVVDGIEVNHTDTGLSWRRNGSKHADQIKITVSGLSGRNVALIINPQLLVPELTLKSTGGKRSVIKGNKLTQFEMKPDSSGDLVFTMGATGSFDAEVNLKKFLIRIY